MEATAVSANSQNSVTDEALLERRLWTAVIVKAVEDWQNGTLRARREAQKFLFEDERDFIEVCGLAGLDAGNFRSKLLKTGRRIEMRGPWANPLAA